MRFRAHAFALSSGDRLIVPVLLSTFMMPISAHAQADVASDFADIVAAQEAATAVATRICENPTEFGFNPFGGDDNEMRALMADRVAAVYDEAGIVGQAITVREPLRLTVESGWHNSREGEARYYAGDDSGTLMAMMRHDLGGIENWRLFRSTGEDRSLADDAAINLDDRWAGSRSAESRIALTRRGPLGSHPMNVTLSASVSPDDMVSHGLAPEDTLVLEVDLQVLTRPGSPFPSVLDPCRDRDRDERIERVVGFGVAEVRMTKEGEAVWQWDLDQVSDREAFRYNKFIPFLTERAAIGQWVSTSNNLRAQRVATPSGLDGIGTYLDFLDFYQLPVPIEPPLMCGWVRPGEYVEAKANMAGAQQQFRAAGWDVALESTEHGYLLRVCNF